MLMIRLRRMGTRNRPFYRMVVSDSKKVPAARAIDEVGFYNPRVQPVDIKVDTERIEHWVSQGARMTPTVARLVRQSTLATPATAEAQAKPASEPTPEPTPEPTTATEESTPTEDSAEPEGDSKAESE